MKLLRFYLPSMPYKVVYMLQQLEYQPHKLWKWLVGFPDLKLTVKRGKLILTNKSKLLLLYAYGIYFVIIGLAVSLLITGKILAGITVLLLTFIVVALAVICISLIGELLLDRKRAPLMKKAEDFFKNYPGERIAVLGSYGKTSMKEILATVLSEKMKVAMTPGNKNVPISHARWAVSLDDASDILVIEYGEGEPGDINTLASLSHPTMAVLTGIAPNHLDQYKTLSALEDDFAAIEQYVPGEKLFVNADASTVISKLAEPAKLYSDEGVDGWKISNTHVAITGTSFVMKRGNVAMKLHSSLLGAHNIGPLAAAAAIAYSLGLSTHEIQSGISKTSAFEHRMQARQLHGAWLIDDTYNGNLEGCKAGLKLLATLEAKRKIYVTPGLVDQGEETERVHIEIGEAIAKASPDKVVLMQNENTKYMQQGLARAEYRGELVIEDDPLSFYTNIEQFVAAGDLVLMQNDLPDAYS